MPRPCWPVGSGLLVRGVGAQRLSKNGHAVLISADEWEAWQETAYLFRSPANARRLLDAAVALDARQGLRVELDTAE